MRLLESQRWVARQCTGCDGVPPPAGLHGPHGWPAVSTEHLLLARHSCLGRAYSRQGPCPHGAYSIVWETAQNVKGE